MKTYSLTYSSSRQLDEFIHSNKIDLKKNILIQIFTSHNKYDFIKNLIKEIALLLPKAKIIGSSTCGEISMQGAADNSTVISFSIFNDTKITTSLVTSKENSYDLGIDMINSFENDQSEELKVIISFADGLHTNGEEYLKGISSVNDNVVIAGGLAGDNSKFEETFVFTENGITNDGAVAAALYNKDLNVFTKYSFNWDSIGKKHIVQRAERNRVYQISGMSPIELYKYYLGKNIADLLPAVGIEFPLVIDRNGVKIARAVLSKHNDGSLSFAGNIDEGSTVTFGHGNVSMILDKSSKNAEDILKHPMESIFIYSCMARKHLLKEEINLELLPLRELAPISGFFTYGEFFYNCHEDSCKALLLNETMTILALSESNQITQRVCNDIFNFQKTDIDKLNLYRTQALSELMEKTTKELNELNKNLEKKVEEEVSRSLEKDAMVEANAGYAQLGEMMEMIIHQWRQPLSVFSSGVGSMKLLKENGLLSDEIFNETTDNLLKYVKHLNQTIEDFRDFFKVNKEKELIIPEKLIKKSLTITGSIITKKGIKLTESYDYNDALYIPVNQILQVILNIIKNSFDAHEHNQTKSPMLEISSKQEEDFCVLSFKDNAGGIPENILPNIFDKHFSTKEKSHGTGIGLNISKTIIESHMKGKLTAFNENGGANFVIKIPLNPKAT